MPKTAFSVTLDSDNLIGLRGRARATGARSVSELLDRIVRSARASGGSVTPSRSAVGTIEIDPRDPSLEHADAALRALFDASLGRPSIAKKTPATYRLAKSRKRRG
jgi:hypothetical protein